MFEVYRNKLNCGAVIVAEQKETIPNMVYISVYDIDGILILDKDSMSKNEWEQCQGYYCYKLNRWLDPEDTVTLVKPYVMFESGERMWKIEDSDYRDNHRSLLRSASPIGFFSEEPSSIDLMTFGGLYIFTYEKDILVFRFDDFYLNGELVGTYKEINDELKMTRSDIDWYDKKVKDYFETKLNTKLSGFKSINADAIY